MCLRPLHVDLIEVGCGQCMNCRFNRQREWITRMMLEQAKSSSSCFLTLTYSDEHLPEHGNLRKKDVQDFLKRERFANGPLRYYGVGEYGDRSWRPHYHLAMFGRDFGYGMVDLPTWTLGHAFSGFLTRQSMRYVAAYLNKRLRKGDKRLEKLDPDTGEIRRLVPEFPLMSLRPGIGATAIPAYGKFFGTSVGKDYVQRNGDVPREVRIGGKRLPLGRYLTNELRNYAWIMPSLRSTLGSSQIRKLSKMRAAVEGSDIELQRDRAARREVSRIRGERLSLKLKRTI